MQELVLNCALHSGLVNLIKPLKFVELLGANMLALTNVAICMNLGFIVHVRSDELGKYDI